MRDDARKGDEVDILLDCSRISFGSVYLNFESPLSTFAQEEEAACMF